jgi:hypothetical protein
VISVWNFLLLRSQTKIFNFRYVKVNASVLVGWKCAVFLQIYLVSASIYSTGRMSVYPSCLHEGLWGGGGLILPHALTGNFEVIKTHRLAT